MHADTDAGLLGLLCDGNFHSGTALGRSLKISRSAVWKRVRSLEKSGIEVYAVPGKGYRLAEPIELLDSAAILAPMNDKARRLLGGLDILTEIDSTNLYLLRKANEGALNSYSCLAEQQHAGRGRRGRVWVSPFGANIYLSLLWRFAEQTPALSGLSLAIGIAVAKSLESLGITGIGVKWPNDLLWQGRKLAGVLLDMAGEAAGPCLVVAGIGVNVAMPAAAAISQPWVDLRTIVGHNIARNALAGTILQQLLLTFQQFQRDGLAPFLAEWNRLDLLKDKDVTVQLADRVISGRAQGVNPQGALLVAHGGVTRAYHSGEVSVRGTE
ncbi:MAG: bifunctional biotin--[acetyl-CoA-carboxylase] ligase/biotin operon repressor BirA [Gammaproteobacteria bacterium]